VYLAFGRPKGDRPSYKQWEEGDVPLTVAFEILSPDNTVFEMADKLAFYDEHGVEEYYVYDPDKNRLMICMRRGEALRRVWQVAGFVSPGRGIRFHLSGPEMVVFRPDGRPFRTFEEVEAERVATEQWAAQAEQADGLPDQAESADTSPPGRPSLAHAARAHRSRQANRLRDDPAQAPRLVRADRFPAEEAERPLPQEPLASPERLFSPLATL
jgi:hypothetical protein